MGFHIAWNYTQSGVFSGIVSGGYVEPDLIKPVIDGPTLLTGGGFGVESSVIAFVLCTVTGPLCCSWQRGAAISCRLSRKREADPARSEEGTSR